MATEFLSSGTTTSFIKPAPTLEQMVKDLYDQYHDPDTSPGVRARVSTIILQYLQEIRARDVPPKPPAGPLTEEAGVDELEALFKQVQ